MFQKTVTRFRQDPHNSDPLLWGRADIDGMPFRGNLTDAESMMREPEFQRRTQEAGEIFYGTFDVSQPEQKQFNLTLKDVMDNITAGWYDLLRYDDTWHDTGSGPTKFVFIIWRENYREKSPYADVR